MKLAEVVSNFKGLFKICKMAYWISIFFLSGKYASLIGHNEDRSHLDGRHCVCFLMCIGLFFLELLNAVPSNRTRPHLSWQAANNVYLSFHKKIYSVHINKTQCEPAELYCPHTGLFWISFLVSKKLADKCNYSKYSDGCSRSMLGQDMPIFSS